MNRPNVLIFMVDQMQYDVTRDDHPCILPAIKRFAKEGVTFTRALTCSPHCCPSRATFMTGCYPSRHGIRNNVNTVTAHRHEMNEGVRTFSEDLREAGYALHFAGKWHVALKKRPAHCGWNELSSAPDDSIHPDKDRFRKLPPSPPARGRGVIRRPGWGDLHMVPTPVPGRDAYKKNWWYDTAIVPALARLRQLGRTRRPWCLFVSTDMDVHMPAPGEYVARYDAKRIELPASFGDTMEDKPNIYRRLKAQYWDQLTPGEAQAAMANYWGLCMREDKHFERLLGALDETGQAANTVVIFVSDHGEYNFAHGLQYMGIPAFREAYHVPAIVRWPRGVKAPGRRVDAFVSLADFAPTILDLAGVKPRDAKTGRSLRPFLEGRQPRGWPDAWFSQTDGNEVYYTQRAVMTRRYKYVYNAFDFDELYDLEHDPHEMVNLIHPSRHRGRGRRGRGPGNPWPHLPPELDARRRDLMARIWRFAYRENDIIFNPFPPVAVAAYGPGARDDGSRKGDGT